MLTNNQKELIVAIIDDLETVTGLASITAICKSLDHLKIEDIHTYMLELCQTGEYAMHATDVNMLSNEQKKYYLNHMGRNYLGICKR